MLRVVRHRRDEGLLLGGAGPSGQSSDSGADAEIARASEPQEWRRYSCSRRPCFVLNANPRTTGTAIPASVPGAPH